MSITGPLVAKVAVSVGAAALVSMSVIGFLQRGDSAPESTGSKAPGEVTIVDFAFDPPAVTVRVGETVTWTNKDDVAHTVTSEEQGPLASGDLAGGAEFKKMFDTPGSFPYICTIHPYMTGTVEVME